MCRLIVCNGVGAPHSAGLITEITGISFLLIPQGIIFSLPISFNLFFFFINQLYLLTFLILLPLCQELFSM